MQSTECNISLCPETLIKIENFQKPLKMKKKNSQISNEFKIERTQNSIYIVFAPKRQRDNRINHTTTFPNGKIKKKSIINSVNLILQR